MPCTPIALIYRPPRAFQCYKGLDKTRVKLFPNFARHHLIRHTNDGDDDDNDDDKNKNNP